MADEKELKKHNLKKSIIIAIVFVIAMMISYKYGQFSAVSKGNLELARKLGPECYEKLLTP